MAVISRLRRSQNFSINYFSSGAGKIIDGKILRAPQARGKMLI